ncbi:caspase family protein [Bradyrhizobium diazoefficiens]|nr:caspase family protein [Bradyrhizobium diazoefficiens]MBR0778691.1 caspase family protein [Bradyrhizobium diazoefficiens]
MRPFIYGILGLLLGGLVLARPALADDRVALVIGNSAYRKITSLPNTSNDANDVAAALRRLGFSSKVVLDGTFDDMRRAILQLGRDAREADMAIIYFAGHGIEVGGENWLIPIDAELRSDMDAESEAVSLKSAMLQAAGARTLGLVILDSCRDNPFAALMQRGSRSRSVDRGLARIEPTDNVLVAYAAKDGTIAADGKGRNSPFTAALLNNLEKAGLEIRFLLASVRDEVMSATKRLQQPFVYGSLPRTPIYLKPPAPASGPASASVTPPQPLTEVERAWAAVQANPSIAALDVFIRRYNDNFYADLARVRIEELKAAKLPSATPTAATSASPRPDASPRPEPPAAPKVAAVPTPNPSPSPTEPAQPKQQAAPAPTPAPTPTPALLEAVRSRLVALSVAQQEADARSRDYAGDRNSKAMAVAPTKRLTWRSTSRASQQAASDAALESCQVYFEEACILVAVGDQIVTATQPRDMTRTRYTGRFEPERIPFDDPKRPDVVSYRQVAKPKAAAFHPWGRLFTVTDAPGQFEAEEKALGLCNDDPGRKGRDGPCFLYAVGDNVVLTRRLTKPRPLPKTLAEAFDYFGNTVPRSFLTQQIVPHKALAIVPETNRTFWFDHQASASEAEQKALEGCQLQYQAPCVLLASDDTLVAPDPWKAPRRDMPRLSREGNYSPDGVPMYSGKEGFLTGYGALSNPKAMAVRANGARVRTATGKTATEAQEKALAACNDDQDPYPCFVYAVNDRLVLSQHRTEPLR